MFFHLGYIHTRNICTSGSDIKSVKYMHALVWVTGCYPSPQKYVIYYRYVYTLLELQKFYTFSFP